MEKCATHAHVRNTRLFQNKHSILLKHHVDHTKYSWIVHQLHIGTKYVMIFAVEVRFQIRDQFWNPQSKLNGACLLD